MLLPISWLKEYVDIDVNIDDFIYDLTMSGSNVEGLEVLGENVKNIVTGKILEINAHPDADKLVVTKVDVGSEEIQIVTGADNINVGDIVPIALNGAVIASGDKIKTSKLRGVTSQGMMCSIEELGYDNSDYPEAPDDGIYIFKENMDLGLDVCPILEIKEEVVEFELTTNRSDCNSILGMAREVSAVYKKEFNYPEIKLKEEGEGDINEMISIDIKNPELCPRYIARVVKNVKIEPSPQWLRHRLTACDIKPINNIVDITNYVMHEMGQPIHAFDIDTVHDRKIIVRNAEEGEKITTLDEIERELSSNMLVIADSEEAIAIAGVMGGEDSKVKGESGTILLESANFNGTNIRLTSKKLGLRTDASAKYEKGLDPNQAIESVNRCAQLIELLGCGEVVKGVVDNYPNKRETWEVEFDANNINKLLGTDIPKADMDDMLERISIKVNGNIATIPTFRPDIECEADIAEEVARFYGYENIEMTLERGTPTIGIRNEKQEVEDKISKIMVSLGFSETKNYAFESPKVFDKLNIPKDSELRKTATIINPLGEDYSIMRTLTLNGMLNNISRNSNRRNESAFFFEEGKVYIPKQYPLTELPSEDDILTIGFYHMENKYDFFYLKGIVNEMLGEFGIVDVEYKASDDYPYMHPYRTADLCIGDTKIGYIGEVHPNICNKYNIDVKAYIGVIEIKYIQEYANLAIDYIDLPKYPAIERDISMLVEEDILIGDIEKAILEKGGKILEQIELFDIYKGDQIDDGYKSVSYSINFRDKEKTLTDKEVAKQMEKILKNLEEKLKVQLRDR